MQVFNSIQDELFKVLLQLDFFSAPGGQADAICEKITSAEVRQFSCIFSVVRGY